MSGDKIQLTKNTLYCAHEGKRNMWLYYKKESKILFVVDPIKPTLEVIAFIDKLDIQEIYVVLTACQREKKKYVILWKHIFASLKVITPDHTLLDKNEVVIPANSMITFSNLPHINFLSIFSNGVHILCMHVHQYLFTGELLYNTLIDKEHLFSSGLIKSYFEKLHPNTITFSSFGPLYLLSSIHLMHKKKEEDYTESKSYMSWRM